MSRRQALDESRRRLLLRSLCGLSLLGVRSVASGIPLSFLAAPERALAQAADPSQGASAAKPQFLVLSTSQGGDPLNCNAPGAYDLPEIVHPSDPRLAPVDFSLGDVRTRAAAPWAELGATALGRAAFIHHSTETLQHLHQPDVHGLMGRVVGKDMAVSAFAARLAPILGTIQAQPVVIGTTDTSEAITYQGRTQPLLNPTALASVLTAPDGPLNDLQGMRDRDLDHLHKLFKARGTRSQHSFLDAYATSREQARQLEQGLLSQLAAITDNGPDGQVAAAIALIKLKVAPVVTIHVPFGGDNHFDGALEKETDQTLSGLSTLQRLFSQLESDGLSDDVTFGSFNVFGRTLKMDGAGRNHNRYHHVTLLVGKHVRAGVYGGITPIENDFGALPIDSQTGAGAPDGDIARDESLTSVGKTMGRSLGLSQADVEEIVVVPSSGRTVGKTIEGALL